MCRKKQRLYNKAKKSGRTKLWEKYKLDTHRALRRAYISYISDIRVAQLKKNGELHSCSQAKAEELLEQFKSVFTKDDGSTTA